MSHATDVDDLTYEQARDELIAIVAKLEAGTATLDESLGLWERGEALAARCQDLLDGARDRIGHARDGDGAEQAEDDAEVEVPDEAADAGVVGVVPSEGDEEDS